MKKSMSLAAVITLVVLGIALATDAEAQFWKGRGQGRGMGPGPNAWCPPGLNLTQEQTERLQNLHDQFFKETATLRTDLRKKQLALETLLIEPSVDGDAAGKLQADISALESRLDQKRMQYQIEARKILTPDQLAELPPGCTMGFGLPGGRGCGFRGGRGPGYGCGMRGW